MQVLVSNTIAQNKALVVLPAKARPIEMILIVEKIEALTNISTSNNTVTFKMLLVMLNLLRIPEEIF